jgi:ApaG protein
VVEKSGNDRVDLLLADLSSLAGIRGLAREFLDSYPALHVLVNNAGTVELSRTTTVDGFEKTFAVNHLAYFLLTNLLLPRLRASAPARIVNVASEAHRFGRLDLADLQSEKSYRAMRVYGTSKLLNILFTVAEKLARPRHRQLLHPGAPTGAQGTALSKPDRHAAPFLPDGRARCAELDLRRELGRARGREREVLRETAGGSAVAPLATPRTRAPRLGAQQRARRAAGMSAGAKDLSSSSAVTHDIRVEVRARYSPEHSEPQRNLWFFLYSVQIANESAEAVQLLSRHWIITDATGRVEEVRGPGVVGENPVIEPGDAYEYTSGCPLPTPFGAMHGSYQLSTRKGKQIEVENRPLRVAPVRQPATDPQSSARDGAR